MALHAFTHRPLLPSLLEKKIKYENVFISFFLILVKRNLREAFMEINEIIVTRQEYSTYKTQTEES